MMINIRLDGRALVMPYNMFVKISAEKDLPAAKMSNVLTTLPKRPIVTRVEVLAIFIKYLKKNCIEKDAAIDEKINTVMYSGFSMTYVK